MRNLIDRLVEGAQAPTTIFLWAVFGFLAYWVVT